MGSSQRRSRRSMISFRSDAKVGRAMESESTCFRLSLYRSFLASDEHAGPQRRRDEIGELAVILELVNKKIG